MDRSSDTPVTPASVDEAAPGARGAGGEGPRLVADNRGLEAVNLGKSFKRRDAFFQNGVRRIGNTRINVPTAFGIEQAGRVFGIPKDK